jgi:hypothetical protein
VPQNALQHGLDVIRRPKVSFEPRATASRSDDHEISYRGVSCAFTVDDDRSPSFEIRLADEELPAPGKLGDDQRHLRGEQF